MALKSDLFDTIYLDTGSTGTAASITKAKVTTWDSLGTGGVPIKSVANIASPTAGELGNGTTQGDLILAYQAAGSASNQATLYMWDTSSAAEAKPYIVAGTGGSWIALAGRYTEKTTALTGYYVGNLFVGSSTLQALNKAGTAYVSYATRNTDGAEAVMNLAYVGNLAMNGKLQGGHTDVVHYQDVLAASTNAVVTISPWDNGTNTSLSAQTDVPRNLYISVTGGNTPTTSGTVTFNGVDADGATIAEVVTVPNDTGSWTDVTDKAFAKLTSVVAADFAGGPFTATTVNVGYSDKVGLPNYPLNSTNDVFKVKKNNADFTNYTANATYGTVDLATISGADDYTIWVRPYKA